MQFETPKGSEATTEAPFCPKHKKTRMIKKRSRFGEFWGCPRFPRCKEVIDIEKHRREKIIYRLSEDQSIIRLYKQTNRDDLYKEFEKTAVFRAIVERDPEEKILNHQKQSLKTVIDLVQEQRLEECINTGVSSSLCDYLYHKKSYHHLAIWSYFLFRICGYLPEQFDYWLKPNGSPRPEEWRVQKAIETDHSNNPFFRSLNIELKYFNCAMKHGIPDIIGTDLVTDCPVALELKVVKHLEGLNQAIRYRNNLKEDSNSPAASYIIGISYPRYFFEVKDIYLKTIGLISYVIENEEILFIPWRMAEYV